MCRSPRRADPVGFRGVIVLADIGFSCIDIDSRTSGGTAPGWVGVASTGCLTLYATGPAGVVGCGREAARIIIPRPDKSDAPS